MHASFHARYFTSGWSWKNKINTNESQRDEVTTNLTKFTDNFNIYAEELM